MISQLLTSLRGESSLLPDAPGRHPDSVPSDVFETMTALLSPARAGEGVPEGMAPAFPARAEETREGGPAADEVLSGDAPIPDTLVAAATGEGRLPLEARSLAEQAPTMPLRFRHASGAEATAGAAPVIAARQQTASLAPSDTDTGHRTRILVLQGEQTLGTVILTPGMSRATKEGEASVPPGATQPSISSVAERPLSAVVHEWAAIKVENSTAGNKAALGEQLLHSLKEKVEMQLNQQVQQARIKLDPPEMGRLELTVRLEGERLHVQLNASQGTVREALASQLDRLRADLLPHHGGGVEVSVGQGDRHGRGDRDDGVIADAAEEENVTGSGVRSRDWINALA